MANIFISYRREDTGGHAGRLCDRLTARFGDAHVFMDLADIAPGQDFTKSIDETIAACDCVIVVIGPRWLEAMQTRAAAAEDFVRHEISAALRRGVRVIPVLVGGARMPTVEQLPAAMSELRHRNALEVRDERFDTDVAILADAIDSRHSRTPRLVPVVAVAGVVAGALLLAYLVSRAGTSTTSGQSESLQAQTAGSPAVNPATVETPAAASALDGDWIAEMQKEGQPRFGIRLTFVVTGDSITGVVRYPTGDAPILEARLAGRVLTFHTSHIPQFESTPAIITFQAAVGPDEMTLTATDDNGITRGVARRRPQDKQ